VSAAPGIVRTGTRVLGMREVRELLSLEDTIELQRRAFASQAHGKATMAPNSWLRLPGERRAWLKLLAGHDENSGALGVKVLARFPERGPGANLASLLLLFDDEDGSPLAIMDAVYVTAVRTAAGAALGTQALARPGARTVGMLGTGTLAWYSVLAHRIVCPQLDELTVYSRSEERREAFARRVEAETEISARPVATVAEAVAGAEVIVTATNAPTPVLLSEHLRPGQHIGAIGIRSEISPDAIARCRVIGDGHDEALHDGKFSTAVAAGVVDESQLGPDLGAVLEGLAPGRTADEEITLFDSSGVAIQDVVCARHAWERAAATDTGVLVGLANAGVLD
jgi:ornithine cyclodeaminase/alanine dehydrogenase-like protein (mu-crystallin family)